MSETAWEFDRDPPGGMFPPNQLTHERDPTSAGGLPPMYPWPLSQLYAPEGVDICEWQKEVPQLPVVPWARYVF